MFPHRHTFRNILTGSLTLLSNGCVVVLRSLFISSDCVRLPPFCFSTCSWIPCSLSSASSSSLFSFFRFALLAEQSSEKRLTHGRREGDLSVVESGLRMTLDEVEDLEVGKWFLLATSLNILMLLYVTTQRIPDNQLMNCPHCCPYVKRMSFFQGDLELLFRHEVVSVL